jgi:hypothetical protein
VRAFWRRDNEFSDLERELRRARSEPRRDFVRSLASRLGRSHGASRPGWRLGLAGAFTVGLLVALVSIGGIGQAAHSLAHVTSLTLAGSVGSSGPQAKREDPKGESKDDDDGSANDQYKEQRKNCKKTEDHRHKNAEESEKRRHKAALAAIENNTSLSKAQKKALKQQEDQTHKANQESEEQTHKQNREVCKNIGK